MTPDTHLPPIDLAREADFALGNLRVRPSLREVSAGGEVETLEPRVMQVLVALAQRRGVVVSRDQLVDRCWSGRTVGEDAIQRCIGKVRRLAELRGGFAIETIARVGYCLTEDTLTGVASDVVPEARAHDGIAAQPDGKAERRRWLLPAAAAALLVATGAGLIRLYATSKVAPQGAVLSATPVNANKPRIAVLPFQDFSPDRSNSFFADGLHADVLGALAMRGAMLEVVPRTTMMTYQAAPQALARVSADLKANYILEGSVRRTGNAVRFTVQLVDTHTQQYVWSNTYERTLADAMTLQEEVAGEIAARLAGKAAASAPKVLAPTSSPEAYDFYLRAKLMQDSDAWNEALPLLTEALARDPQFAAALTARAMSHYFMIIDNFDETQQRLDQAHADLDAARRLLGRSAPTVLALEALLADLEAPDHANAIHGLQAAAVAGSLDPSIVSQQATLLMLDDRLEDSIALLQTTAARDPGNLQVLMVLGSELGLARRPVEAMRTRNILVNQYPDAVFQLLRGRLTFNFTGRTDTWRKAADRHRDALTGNEAIYRTHWDLLRFERRHTDLKRALDSVTAPTLSGNAITSGGFSLCCVGRRPTAEYRGWANLLNEDKAAAAREGRAVLEFVAREPRTRWNDWYLRTLAAEGLLFTGKPAPAIAAAQEALVLMPRKRDTLRSRYASAIAARVLAWAGAQDEAVTVLEQLATLKPGLGPAEITRDPLYSIPLAGNVRYRALAANLESEIKRFDADIGKLDVLKD